MAEVGVRELKQRLSSYLARAARGEQIVVTERGRPKAVLAPLPGRERIEQGIAEGWLTRSSGDSLRPTRRWRGNRRVSEALEDDRGA